MTIAQRLESGIRKYVIPVPRDIYRMGLLNAAKLFILSFSPGRKWRIHYGDFELCVRGQSTDVNFARGIFSRLEYPVLSGADSFDLIIDGGSNVGYSVAFFRQNYPKAKIVALEIEQSNYSLLCENTASMKGVECRNEALWKEATRVKIANPDSDRSGFLEKGEFHVAPCKDGNIQSTTILEILARYPLARGIIVKLDIEGAEAEVFKDVKDWIRRVEYVFVEVHGCWKQVFDSLINVNYRGVMRGEYFIIQNLDKS